MSGKFANVCYLAHLHTDLCQQTNFFRAKSLWHTFPPHFFFFSCFFLGGLPPQGDAYNHVWACVCVCMCEGQTWLSNAWSPGQEPRKTTTDTHTHTHERKVMNYPGYKNCNTYEREGGNSTKSRGWVSPQLSAVVLLLIDYCFPSLRKSQANGGSDAFCGHPFRTLRAYLTFIRFFFIPFRIFPAGEMSHKYDLYMHTQTC